MGLDRFIKWGKPPEWGKPTIEKLAAVAQDFLGKRWKVYSTDATRLVCECKDKQTFALRSERDEPSDDPDVTTGDLMYQAAQEQTRGFEVFFLVEKGKIKQTSVITRQADDFTSALADRYAQIIARWWNGAVQPQ